MSSKFNEAVDYIVNDLDDSQDIENELEEDPEIVNAIKRRQYEREIQQLFWDISQDMGECGCNLFDKLNSEDLIEMFDK